MKESYDGFEVLVIQGRKHLRINNKAFIGIHRYIYQKVNGVIPPRTHIHHIDGDPTNNDISNLKAVSSTEHGRLHAGWVMEDGEWDSKPCPNCGLLPIDEFYSTRDGKGWSKLCKHCMRKRTRDYARANPEKYNATMRRYYAKRKAVT